VRLRRMTTLDVDDDDDDDDDDVCGLTRSARIDRVRVETFVMWTWYVRTASRCVRRTLSATPQFCDATK